jgi:Fe-S cluster assembly protein SufD
VESHQHKTWIEYYHAENLPTETTIHLAPHAKLRHIIFYSGTLPTQIAHTQTIYQSDDSHYACSHYTLPGIHQKNSLTCFLQGQKSNTEYRLLHLGQNQDHQQTQITIHHEQPHNRSYILARSVMDQQAQGILTGKIIVYPHASQSQAHFESKSLLLAPQARVHSYPELEIYHHDVQCTHGATVGHLDEDALFYLCSRGLPRTQAMKMLIHSFISPTLAALNIPECIAFIQKVLDVYPE